MIEDSAHQPLDDADLDAIVRAAIARRDASGRRVSAEVRIDRAIEAVLQGVLRRGIARVLGIRRKRACVRRAVVDAVAAARVRSMGIDARVFRGASVLRKGLRNLETAPFGMTAPGIAYRSSPRATSFGVRPATVSSEGVGR